jgi:hypothetical protein
MKKQALIIFATCALLSAVSGCHQPVNGVVLLPNRGSYPTDPPAIYAEEGGTLEFRDETPGAPPFQVELTDPDVCKEGREFASKSVTIGDKEFQSATCHVNKKEGDFKYMIHKGKGEDLPPIPREFYVRPCPTPCKSGI